MDGLDWTAGALGELHDTATGRRFDRAALAAAVRRRSDELADHGVRPGHVVTVSREETVGAVIDLLASWRVGAAVAMLDPALSTPERANVLRLTRPLATIVEDGAIRVWTDEESRLEAGRPRERAALILFTSGTTGVPKGVVLSMRAIEARLSLNAAAIGRNTLRRTLLTLPLHFGHGLIGGTLTALLSGGLVVVAPRGMAGAAALGPTIDAHAITFLTSVPTLWRIALRASRPPEAGSLERVHVGSAPLGTALWERIAGWCGAPVHNCYGITETANWIGGTADPRGDGHVGVPWGGDYAVRDANGAIHAAGADSEVQGEVLVRSPTTMTGYLDRPDDTAAVLGGGWYATGDTGRLDAHGLTLTGRIKEEINRGGTKVQPADVDVVLEAHPDVAEACCFALPDAVAGECVAAAVVARDGATVEAEALAAWVASRMRPVARPERLFVVDAIPRNARGKVSRRDVAAALAPEPVS